MLSTLTHLGRYTVELHPLLAAASRERRYEAGFCALMQGYRPAPGPAGSLTSYVLDGPRLLPVPNLAGS